MEQDQEFEKDNAFLLSKFEEVSGSFEQLKAQSKSQKNQILGLNHQNEKHEVEIKSLRKINSQLREEIKELRLKLDEESRLIPQNFKIRNKIVKIVSDIEDKESMNQQNLTETLDLLIEEIDFCINQLAK
jgi:predicted RNase H-like nuclease (RuvC/YqgF family)